jgi:hypothetical protein
MNVKFEALAYRIWASANPRGWDCLMSEVASDIGVPTRVVSATCTVKGWGGRFRPANNSQRERSGLHAPQSAVNEVIGDVFRPSHLDA